MKKTTPTPHTKKPFKAPTLIAKERREAASGSCGLTSTGGCGSLVQCYHS